MPLGTILLRRPGRNEGKARYETLGIYERKVISSSVGAALTERAFGLCRYGSWLCIRWESAAPTGLNKCISMLNPGLAPWAMQGYRPCRARFGECVVKIGMGEGGVLC